ncbi:MAG: sodium-dependent bicarbonate transport family permease [Bacteroidia bacterium]
MSTELLYQNLINPPILFFFLGLIAIALRSDLEIPQPISKFLSLYLLFAIGLKGGVELGHGGLSADFGKVLLLAVGFACLVPLYAFFILKKRFKLADAAALAATYGSVSAVTFITASSYLQEQNVEYGGYMVAMLALMESPAIILGVMLFQKYRKAEVPLSQAKIWHEALTNGSVVLVLGSLLIGIASPDAAVEGLLPFTNDIFKGFLAFFLLDMGLLAGRRFKAITKAGWFPWAFGILLPVTNALLAAFLGGLLGLSVGNTYLMCILAASASYIAVPAAMRMSIPEANPGLYVPMSLAITFPFNIIVGLPLYMQFVHWFN